MIDFAGSGVVHTVGGVCGLVGAVMLGPRLEAVQGTAARHSVAYQVLGTFILW